MVELLFNIVRGDLIGFIISKSGIMFTWLIQQFIQFVCCLRPDGYIHIVYYFLDVFDVIL